MQKLCATFSDFFRNFCYKFRATFGFFERNFLGGICNDYIMLWQARNCWRYYHLL